MFFFMLTGFLLFKIHETFDKKEKTLEQLVEMPTFTMKTLENNFFADHNMKKGVKTIMIHFNSECDICQNEALKFKENIALLQEYQIFYISAESPDKIERFSIDFGLNRFKNITFLFDENKVFYRWVKSSQVPYILAYNANNHLIYKHKGLTNFDELLNALENED